VALLNEAPSNLAWQAEELLFRLAGPDSPRTSVASAGLGERREYRQQWEAWWRERGPALDLAQFQLEQPLQGLTLLVAFDGYQGNGRVWELGPDNALRWEITNVRGPLNAHVLPGERVLIAEYNGYLISERDFKGKILWEYRAASRPVACWRLPSGNTLLATNNAITEVTPARKPVATYSSRQGLICDVQPLRNGNLAYITLQGVFVEIDRRGKEIRQFKFDRPTDGKITLEALPGGRYLIPLSTAGKVAEFDGSGKIVWQAAVPSPNGATRLPNGNTLVCSRRDSRVVEIDRTGKIVWEQKAGGHLFNVRRR
jgi:outer membrane protein assembly factor BamB